MFLEFLGLFLTVYFFGSPAGISFLLGHLGTVIVSLSSLKRICVSYFFWFLLLLTIFFASEVRFSLEYILLATTFFYLGSEGSWNNENSFGRRRRILFLIFLSLVIINHLRFDLSEKGSLLIWLPVYLALYFEKINKSNFLIYLFSGLFLFFSNKFTALLALICSLRSKVFYFLSLFIAGAYFVFKENLSHFISKSFEPRIYIWKSAFNGFLGSPIFGHGFGTFALDFPLYRAHAKVFGGRVSEQIVHGHSLLAHYAFELGVIGLILVFILFYLVFINKKSAFLPLLVVCIFDAPIVTFNQFALAGVLLIPFIKDPGVFRKVFSTVENNAIRTLCLVFALVVVFLTFIPSLVGHFYYSKNDLDRAIKWDKKNSLYYFTRGANNINKDTIQSEKDFLKAIEISSSVPYFYGFLGASQLANSKFSEAKQTLEKAMKLDGQDGYWCLLYSYANYNNKKIFEQYQRKALKRNPEIKHLLSKPNITSAKYLGIGKGGDSRLAGFYRTGEDIYFPLPIVK